jgi:hypothetical protein
MYNKIYKTLCQKSPKLLKPIKFQNFPPENLLSVLNAVGIGQFLRTSYCVVFTYGRISTANCYPVEKKPLDKPVC